MVKFTSWAFALLGDSVQRHGQPGQILSAVTDRHVTDYSEVRPVAHPVSVSTDEADGNIGSGCSVSLGEQPEVGVLHGRRDLDSGGVEERHVGPVPRHDQVAAGAEPLEPAQLQEFYASLQVTHPVLQERAWYVN